MMARRENSSKAAKVGGRSVTASAAEARRLLAIVEKSQVPFGESAPIYARIKAQVEAGKNLSIEDYEHLLRLVEMAKEWEKAVKSSAMTEPEETLSG
jgi:hypothetical protein